VTAQVEKIKESLAEIEALASEVETLGAAATEAQRQADQARALVNMSEEEVAALEQRLNPAAGIWLNIGIGVVMLFVGYFLEKFLDRFFKKREPDTMANRVSPTELPVTDPLEAEEAVADSLAAAEPTTAAVVTINPLKAGEAQAMSTHNPAIQTDA
jgi:hypothetical protein